jgi:uncharacterized protein YhaN
LRRHDAAEAWLAAHPDAPVLPEDLAGRLQAAREQAAQAARGAEEAARQHRHLLAEAAELVPGAAWLGRADRIAALRDAAGTAERARQELPALRQEQRDGEARLRDRLRALGMADDADAAALLPPQWLLDKARRLLREHASLAEAEARAPQLLQRQRDLLREAEAALAALPPPWDLEALEMLVATLRAEGDPAILMARESRAVAEAEAAWTSRAARLPAAWRSAGMLRALPLPPGDALLRLGSAMAEAEAALRQAEAVLAQCSETLAGSEARRAALEAAGTLPDAAALAAARNRRQESWLRLRRAEAGPAEATAFEALVAEADRIADLRFAEATRLRDAEVLAATLARDRAEHAAALRHRDAASQAAEAANQAWGTALHPLQLEAAIPPAALQAALAARETALDAAEMLDRQRAAAAERAERQAAGALRLCAALGEPVPAPLVVALDRAEAALRAGRAADNARAQQQRLLADRRQALAEAEQEAASQRQRLLAWQAEWRNVQSALGRPPQESPDDGAAVLDLLGQLGPLLQGAAALQARGTALQAELASFEANCRTLCAELGEAEPADPVLAARRLGARLQAEQALQSRRDTLQQQAEKAARSAATLTLEAENCAAALRRALAEAGAADPDAALARLALSAERAARVAARNTALAELLADGDGLDLPTLRAEQAAQPPDVLELALADARAAGDAAQRAAEEAAQDCARAEAEMQRLSQDGAAREAAADEQAALARLGQLLEEAVLLQAARSLLGAAMGQVQQAGDDALLRRIGGVFAALTDGAYPSLVAREDDKGVAHLMVRRAAPEGEEAGVDALSEGTRDQLFLALRLIAIEDHAATATPLPFLGDDILQSFDDGRAAAAFRALCRLSQTTQVILLTHHRHLVEVARVALPDGTLHLQELA